MAVFEGNFTHTEHLKFAIVSGRFNDLIMSKLLQGCKDALQRHGVNVSETDSQVDYVLVPGSFELPMVARQIAATGKYDAVICLGAVIRGQTPHFDYVAGEAAKGIAAAAFQTGVPIIFGVITADTMQQALEVVERLLAKENVESSNLFTRFESKLGSQVNRTNYQPIHDLVYLLKLLQIKFALSLDIDRRSNAT
jgi:6,7-dimethyl-8-ribityllumazine synthase